MKRIKYYKELSNIIDGYIILIKDFKLSKNPLGAKCYYRRGIKVINKFFDDYKISYDAYNFFMNRLCRY